MDTAGNSPGEGVLRILVCSREPWESGCSMLRVRSPLERDGKAILRLAELEEISEQLGWAELVLIQRNYPSSAMRQRRVLRHVYASGLPIVYETDDNLLATDKENPHYRNHTEGRPFLRRALRHASRIVVSTRHLGEMLPAEVPANVVPNLLDDRIWSPVPVVQTPSKVVIGFAGTATHAEDLRSCVSALARIGELHGDAVGFVFLGCCPEGFEGRKGVTSIPFCTDYREYSRRIMAAGIHVGIAPLQDTPFNRAKSSIKWLENSICGIAGIYSDLEPYRDVVEHGVNGMLIGGGEEDWFLALDMLVRDHGLRYRLARRAQDDVLASHTLSVAGGALERVLRDVRSVPIPPLSILRRVRNFLWL